MRRQNWKTSGLQTIPRLLHKKNLLSAKHNKSLKEPRNRLKNTKQNNKAIHLSPAEREPLKGNFLLQCTPYQKGTSALRTVRQSIPSDEVYVFVSLSSHQLVWHIITGQTNFCFCLGLIRCFLPLIIKLELASNAGNHCFHI